MFATENANGGYKVTPTMKYYVPEGCTIRQAGFLFSRATDDPEKLVLGNVGNDNVKKHLIGEPESSMIYAMNIGTSYADRVFNVVAFVTYEDASNNIITLYTPVSSGSYYSLNGIG